MILFHVIVRRAGAHAECDQGLERLEQELG